jgi:hypothetical protein
MQPTHPVTPASSRWPLARLILAPSLLAVAVSACDCEAEPLDQVNCDFTVSTPDGVLSLEFPDTEVGGERGRAVTVANAGNRTLETFDFAWDDRNADNYELSLPDPFRVEVNDDNTFTVLFKPIAESPNLGAGFVISHPAVSGAGCPSYRIQIDGSSFERIEFDAGPDGGQDAGYDAGYDGGYDAGVLIDGGVVTPPDAGVTLPPGARFRARGAFQQARAGFAAVALPDATVIAIGGYGETGQALDTIERFDPATGISRVVARMAVTRAEPGAALLDDGRIVIAGGLSSPVAGESLRLVEIFDPATGQVACPSAQGGCGLGDNDSGLMSAGRIDPLVVSLEGVEEVAVMLGRGKCDDDPQPVGCSMVEDVEIPLAGGERINVAGAGSTAALTGAGLLAARVDEMRLVRPDKGALIFGGRPEPGFARADLLLFNRQTGDVGTLTPTRALPARAGASGTVLGSDVLIAGGVDMTSSGVLTMDRVIDPFDDDNMIDMDTEEVAGIELETRFFPTLASLPGDLVLLAGGAGEDPGLLTSAGSVVPRADAHLFVTVGSSFLRVSPDNDLAVPRWFHESMTVTIPGDDAGTPEEDAVLFLGGSALTPRRVPHPQAERFRLPRNAFEVWGLMGPGAAFAANAPAALYSLGGIDPHTGGLSTRVRAFDTQTDVFEDRWPLDEPRADHSATLLDDDNTFLIAGGRDASGQVLGSASLYNPFNDYAEPLPVTLNRARAGHTATRLDDGTVLLCGGQGTGGEALDTCEIFEPPGDLLDPDTYDDARFNLAEGRMSAGRIGHTATWLPDTGEVLLVGVGDVEVDIVEADLFSVSDGRVRSTGLPALPRRFHAAAYLGSGRVLIAGGETSIGGIAPTATAEVYERANGIFTQLSDEMSVARVGAQALPLLGGDVLIAGGTRVGSGAFPTRSVSPSELYQPGVTGIGEFTDSIDVPLTFGRSDLAGSGEVFGRGVAAGGNRRDGLLLSGDERHSPLYFVDKLVNPDEEPDAGP